jgi:hypothetical protein
MLSPICRSSAAARLQEDNRDRPRLFSCETGMRRNIRGLSPIAIAMSPIATIARLAGLMLTDPIMTARGTRPFSTLADLGETLSTTREAELIKIARDAGPR